MSNLTFVTGNAQKFEIAEKVWAGEGITLVQSSVDIDEIQSENPQRIIRDKAEKAFQSVKGPVVVNDDSWSFPGLGGFPGPYMKSMVHWLGAEDFLRLTLPLDDRRVILTQWIAYQDDTRQQLFKLKYEGTILPEIRGTSGTGLQRIITMPGDNGLSIAEAYDKGTDPTTREVAEGWRQCIAWYKEELA